MSGSQFTDGVRVGKAGQAPYDSTGRSLFGTITDFGAPVSPSQVYDVVPVALVTNGLAQAQAVAGAGNLTLNGSLVTGGVGVFDVIRCPRIVSSDAGDTTQLATFYGFDYYGVALTSTVTLNGTTPVIAPKAMKTVTRVAINAACAGNISAGSSDSLGLPFRADAVGYVQINYNSTVITASTGFTAAVTTAASATTGDVRGTYALQSASDAAKRFVANILIKNPDTMTGLYGVVQA